MRNIADTIKRLNVRQLPAKQAGIKLNTNLKPISDFGSNPGNLLGWTYIPEDLPAHAPLIVILHGCTQTAAEYDLGSGWSELAEKYGFALLFPEQQRANNPNLCFNWFATGDITRGHGEVLSIKQMVAALTAQYELDSTRTFATGLSAGGAMTAALLACYPELFKAGAIIAGLPYATASTIPEAFDRMRGHGLQDSETLAGLVRTASDYKGPWPMISVWHGSSDSTVAPVNMEAIIAQWHCLHNIGEIPTTRTVDGHIIRRWSNAEGKTVIEAYTIDGMAHGTPISTSGPHSFGTPRPFILDIGISSTWHIANSWGLLLTERVAKIVPLSQPARERPSPPDASHPIGTIIENALRAAGLMK